MPLDRGVTPAPLIDRIAAGVVRVRVAADRVAPALLGIVLLVMTAVSVMYAHATRLEHDEIYTVELAGLPSVAAIWDAAFRGADLMPPLNTMVTHVVDQVVPLTEVTARLPPLIAYVALSAVLFEAVRRRANALTGVAAVLVLFFSAAFPFSYTARGYELTLFFMTAALFAWAESARGRHRGTFLTVLAVAVAAAVWAHYFAVLIVVPIAVGEAVRAIRTRQIDRGVAAALAGAALLVAPLVPLARTAAADSATFWRRATWTDLGATYRLLAHSLIGPRFVWLWIPVIAVCVLTGAVRRRGAARSLPAHEVAAGIALGLIPALAVASGVLVTGAFVSRYAIAGVVGLALDVSLLVWWAGSATGATELVLCLVLAAGFIQSVYESTAHRPVRMDAFATRPLLRNLLEKTDAVAVTGVTYLECWYYARADIRSRITYVADPSASLALVGSDTLDRNYLALHSLIPIQVEDYASYTATHSHFGIYAEGLFGWLPAKLASDGALVTRVGGSRSGVEGFEVTMAPNGNRQVVPRGTHGDGPADIDLEPDVRRRVSR